MRKLYGFAALFFLFWTTSACQLISSLSEDRIQFTWSDGLNKLRVKARGDIQFTQDDTDVESLSSDAFLQIEERRGFTVRMIEIEPDPQGKPMRSYYVGGSPHDLDAEARQWLSKVLRSVIRETGFSAEVRVVRIHAQSGPQGVLEEISEIRSDRVKAVYFEHFLKLGPLNSEVVRTVVHQVSEQIASDGEKTGLLARLAEDHFVNQDLQGPLIGAVDSIHSDGDRARLLSKLLKTEGAGSAVVTSILGSVAKISSDGDKARLLAQSVTLIARQTALHQTFFEALNTVHSDGERRRVLEILLEQKIADHHTRSALLASIRKIHSDGEKAHLLRLVAGQLEEAEYPDFFEAVRGIHSDGDKASALFALLDSAILTQQPLERLLQVAAEIRSDGDKARVLSHALNRIHGEQALPPRFFHVLDTLHSDGEKSKVLSEVFQSQSLDKPTLHQALDVAARVTSDGDKARLLVQFAKARPLDQALTEPLLAVAETLHSDGEYRKVMRVLLNRETARRDNSTGR